MINETDVKSWRKGMVIMKKQFKTNFTLVELVLVLMVLFLGGTLLIAVESEAAKKVQGDTCLERMSRSCKAMLAWGNDNDGVLPLKKDDGGNGHLLYQLARAKKADGTMYLESPSDTICPDAKPNNQFPSNGDAYYGVPYTKTLHPGNSAGDKALAYQTNEGFSTVIQLDGLKSPENMMLFADTWNSKTNTQYMFFLWSENETAKLHFRHGGKLNVAWADGHVSGNTMDDLRKEWKSRTGGSSYVYDESCNSVAF